MTAAERRQGESLDQRLAEEMPDIAEPDGDGIGDCQGTDGEAWDNEVGASRSVVSSPPMRERTRTTSGLIATDVGIDGAAASAEEAAMHIVDEDTTSG